MKQQRDRSRPVVNPGTLAWSGEHWINYLRSPGDTSDSGMVSLYHTRYSPAGEGNVAFVDIPWQGDCLGLFYDNRSVAEYVREMIRGRGNPFARDLPRIKAQIRRGGDVRHDPSWIIESEKASIVAAWTQLDTPIIVEGSAPVFGADRDFFTLLFFSNLATIHVNDRMVQGEPYLREIWQPSIGGLRSSCVFALAETMVMVPESPIDNQG